VSRAISDVSRALIVWLTWVISVSTSSNASESKEAECVMGYSGSWSSLGLDIDISFYFPAILAEKTKNDEVKIRKSTPRCPFYFQEYGESPIFT
jgi:hypothetical protein